MGQSVPTLARAWASSSLRRTAMRAMGLLASPAAGQLSTGKLRSMTQSQRETGALVDAITR